MVITTMALATPALTMAPHDGVYSLSMRRGAFRVVVRDGVVAWTAPSGRWMVGWSREQLAEFVDATGADLLRFAD